MPQKRDGVQSQILTYRSICDRMFQKSRIRAVLENRFLGDLFLFHQRQVSNTAQSVVDINFFLNRVHLFFLKVVLLWSYIIIVLFSYLAHGSCYIVSNVTIVPTRRWGIERWRKGDNFLFIIWTTGNCEHMHSKIYFLCSFLQIKKLKCLVLALQLLDESRACV